MRILSQLKYAILAVLSSVIIFTSDTPPPSAPPCNMPDHPDYAPLMALYNATDGPNWNNNTGWGEDCDVCGWYGVNCTDVDGRVTIIMLNNNNISGVLPDEIESLTNLKVLNLSSNPLNIEFPLGLFSLASLETINLSNCGLKGFLPDQFNLIPRLKILNIRYNELVGPIPSSIYTLADLSTLDLSNNDFVGGFLNLFGGLTSLRSLSAINTKIGGVLPSSIGSASQLENIYLGNSQISGSLPESLFDLENLSILQLQNNQITGSLISKIENLTELASLNLSNNSIEGAIPNEIGNLNNLKTLILDRNLFSGEIPESIYNLSGITYLNLSLNELVGPISLSIGNLINLGTLNLSRNNLGGELPVTFSSLLKLQSLYLTDINVSGEITNQFDGLSMLSYVYLGENNFEGSFPVIFAELPSIAHLNLSNNKFTNCFQESYSKFCLNSFVYLNNNCQFENPTYSEFCAGAVCNNTLNMSASDLTVCEGEIISLQPQSNYTNYQWSEPNQTSKILSATATTSKYYYITVTNSKGCTKTDSIFIEVTSTDPGFETADVCTGKTVTINGEDFDTPGTFQQLIPRPGSCDSIVNVTITQIEGTTGSYAETICPGSTTTINGQDFGPGESFQTIDNQAGCDSIITINIDEHPTYETNLEFDVCEGNTYNHEGTELSAGPNTLNLLSEFSCDSTVNIYINENLNTYETVSASFCSGGQVEINNESFDFADTYTRTLTNNNQCDSILTIIITEKESTSGNVAATICEGDSVLIAGYYYFDGGTFTRTLTNSEDCDSILNISVTALSSETIFLNEFICQEESFEIGTETFNTGGNYEVVLNNQNGCDSIINLNLTVISGEDQIIYASTCAGIPYSFAGKLYYNSTVVQDSVVIAGCKSLTTLNLEVKEPIFYEYDEYICQGGYAYFHGLFYTKPTSKSITFKTKHGCDSTVTMHLYVEEHKVIEIDTFLCAGSSLYFDNNIYNSPGRIEIPRKTAFGCDSITYLNIDLYEMETDTFYAEVCEGNETEFLGTLYGKGEHSGTYDDGNCAQNFELIVSEVGKLRYDEVITICAGGEAEFMGVNYSEGATHHLNIDINECEILENLFIIESSNEDVIVPQIFCEGSSFNLDGNEISESGDYYISSADDCQDKYVSVLFLNGDEVTLEKTIEEGQAFEFNGELYNTSGIYEIIVGSENGCPTVLILKLNVEKCGGLRMESIVLCDGETFTFFGQDISTTGIYEYAKSLAIGCDSLIQLSATVVNEISFNIEGSNFFCPGEEIMLLAPEGYEYLWSNGAQTSSIVINKGGQYELTIYNENNCPSYAEIFVEEILFPSSSISIYVEDPTTCDAQNGEIELEVEMESKYLYSIDGGENFQISTTFTNLPNGSYNIVLSDLLSRCSKVIETPVVLESDGVPQIQAINITPINDCLDQLGSIEIIPSDDEQDYQFSIDNGGQWSDLGLFENLDSGKYEVLMGVLGSTCLNNLSAAIILENVGNLDAKIQVENHISCTDVEDGAVSIQVLSGQPPYNIEWSNGGSGLNQNSLSVGQYFTTVTDANGCSQVLDVLLEGVDVDDLLSDFEDVILCANDAIVYESDSSFQYILFKGNDFYYEGTSPSISEVGTYQIIIENGAGCIADKYFEVEEIDLSELGIDFLLSTEAVKGVEVIAVNVSDPMPEFFEWSFDTSSVLVKDIDMYSNGLTFQDTGSYKISLLTAVNGCLASFDKTIVVYADSSGLGSYEEPRTTIDVDQFGSWEVFENPSNGQFNVEINVSTGKIPLQLAIYDIYGALIESRTLRGKKKYLETYNLYNSGTGVYTIVLRASTKQFSKNILIVK